MTGFDLLVFVAGYLAGILSMALWALMLVASDDPDQCPPILDL